MTLTETIAITEEAGTVEDAIPLAVRDHARFVFGVAYAVLRNSSDAEDAVQETFLRAMRHRREFAKLDDQRAWLARTAWRIAIDQTRRKPQPSLSDESNQVLLGQLREAELRQAESDAANVGAEAVAINEQMLGLMHALIATLQRPLREVLVLSTVEEMTSREIAAVLGIPDATVRTRLLRARLSLEEKFAVLLRKRSGRRDRDGEV